MLEIHGSIVALVTPMSKAGAIDLDGLGRLVDFHLAHGSDGLLILGTTGEAATISLPEREVIIKQVVCRVAGQIPVIVGTGSNNTAETIERTREAKLLGADAALIVTPYYNKPTQYGLFLHYKAIAEAVDLPLVLYNVPTRTGVDLTIETITSLSKLDNVIAIKDATGELSRVAALAKTSLLLLSGDDASASRFVSAGGHGVISVAANLVPKHCHDLIQASIKGADSASDMDVFLSPLYECLFWVTNPIPVKWALARMGFIENALRLPLTPLPDQFKDSMRHVLRQLNIPLLNQIDSI